MAKDKLKEEEIFSNTQVHSKYFNEYANTADFDYFGRQKSCKLEVKDAFGRNGMWNLKMLNKSEKKWNE